MSQKDMVWASQSHTREESRDVPYFCTIPLPSSLSGTSVPSSLAVFVTGTRQSSYKCHLTNGKMSPIKAHNSLLHQSFWGWENFILPNPSSSFQTALPLLLYKEQENHSTVESLRLGETTKITKPKEPQNIGAIRCCWVSL